MFRSEEILTLLDSRSFGSVWFWLLLILGWTVAGRRIAGVPLDVVTAARRAARAGGDDPAAVELLDWLSLTLPRWRLAGSEGAVMLGLAAFVLTTLAVLGFAYDLEMARALVLVLAPFLLVYGLELRLARRLDAVLAKARQGAPVEEAAAIAAGLMRRHRLVFMLVLFLGGSIVAIQSVLWALRHPFGF